MHLGNGRWYDPAMGRPLQPNPAGGPPTIPQALNRYAATPVGQPGVAEGAGSGLSSITIASYIVGFGKSLAQEVAAARNIGIFGRDAVVGTSLRYAGRTQIAFEASASSLIANRSAIEATGGVFIEGQSLKGIHRTLKSGDLSKLTFRADIFRYESTLDEVTGLAASLRLKGSLVQSGFWEARTSVYLSELERVPWIGRVARFSWSDLAVIGFAGDTILGGGFQYLDDLSNPYFTPGQRGARAGIAGFGNGAFGFLGGTFGASLGCGHYAPFCAAGGSLVGALLWGFGLQPLIFDAIPGLDPARNLAPLH